MKKRIATLLTLALSTTLLLGGCGGSSDTETSNNDSGNSSGGFLSNVISSKSDTLSEVLSTGKVIAYKVGSVDKAKTPDTLYFFDNGKVTIIPGKEFGLTMGDFAKMSDDEIWEKYQTVKETFREKYITQEKENLQINIDAMQEAVLEPKYNFVMDAAVYLPNELYENIFLGGEMSGEAIINAYNEVVSFAQQNGISRILEMCEGYGIEEMEEIVEAEVKAYIEDGQWFIDNIDDELLSVELPFSFVVFTDSSGNNVASETMVYPDFYLDTEKRTRGYTLTQLDFVLGSTRQEQIYDTTYNCIDLRGNGIFLTRETMDIDTLDSKNVLIDLSDSEMKELFKDEVTSK